MNNPDASPSPFTRLHHIALVVESLDASVAHLERLGFGPFIGYPPLSEYLELDVPDPEAFYDLRIMVCDLGRIALQVIEAKDSNTIYGDFLRAKGEGVFHLGFEVDDIESAAREAKRQGLDTLSSGRRADGSGFSYFNTAADVGVTLLLRQSPPPEG